LKKSNALPQTEGSFAPISDDYSRRSAAQAKDNERNFGQADDQWLVICIKSPVDKRLPIWRTMGLATDERTRCSDANIALAIGCAEAATSDTDLGGMS
jgi:hypothetical protein